MPLRYPSLSRRLASAAALVALMAGVACSDDDPAPTAPAAVDVQLSETFVQLVRGQSETAQVTATVEGSANNNVTWTSANTAVATVSPSGVITAVADGETFVTARSEADPSANRSVVVHVVSTVVSVTPAARFSHVGGPSRQFTSTVQFNPNTNVTWSSSNALVATVSASGVASPVGPGTAQIIATSVADPTKSASASFTVDPAPTGTQLTSGQAVAGLSGSGRGTFATYHIVVPPGATELRVTLAGGSGDADIYVYRGALASANLLCAGENAGNTELCTVANPQERVYYVLVAVWDDFAGATLTATATTP